jgi:hypothetical protein
LNAWFDNRIFNDRRKDNSETSKLKSNELPWRQLMKSQLLKLQFRAAQAAGLTEKSF